jgi:hypothetical protein
MRLHLIAAAAAAALAASPALAQQIQYAAGVGVGTMGPEAQFAVGLSDYLSVRVGGNYLNFSYNTDYAGIGYDTRLRATTGSAVADFRPFMNAFTVSAGAYIGSRKAEITSTPSQPVKIGGQTFTPAQVGTLSGDIDLGEVAPYLGIGYDNTFTTQGRIGLRASVGVAVGKSPRATLTSTGGVLSLDPTFQQALKDEEASIAHDAELLRYYPVVSAGVFVKF